MASTGHLTAALAAAMAGLAPAGPPADTRPHEGPQRDGLLGDDPPSLLSARRGAVALVQAAAARRPAPGLASDPWRVCVRGAGSAA